jgi:hypothetical protein
MANCTPQALPPLLRLPTELQLHIVAYLNIDTSPNDLFSLTCLRFTCRYFHYIIPAPNMDHPTLLCLEPTAFARRHYLFTCCYCVRLRHLFQFSLDILFLFRTADKITEATRYCVDCGFKKGKRGYWPGQIVRTADRHLVLCAGCKTVHAESYMSGECEKYCRDCFGKMKGCGECGDCVFAKEQQEMEWEKEEDDEANVDWVHAMSMLQLGH